LKNGFSLRMKEKERTSFQLDKKNFKFEDNLR
jgi:hypothetical protein